MVADTGTDMVFAALTWAYAAAARTILACTKARAPNGAD
jgi:hypothetical protein